jgi:hypothetical protein
MKEEARNPEGQAAPITSDKPEIPEVLQNKVVETYQEVATVLANQSVVINKYT